MPVKAPKTSRHLEVERKFDVVESTVSPSFEGIAAVAQVDKSPIESLDASDQDTVPSELRDVVLAIVRERPLEPVARISTERETQVLYGTDGAALAEFSNDHVTAWAAAAPEGSDTRPAQQEWREWELELTEADETNGAPNTELLTRLSNRLLDAGATPAGHASKLARV